MSVNSLLLFTDENVAQLKMKVVNVNARVTKEFARAHASKHK